MAKKIQLKIVTPERLVLEELVDQVTLPASEGEITVLPGHIPLITGLGSGDVVALIGGEHVPMAVSGGFMEIKPARPDDTGRSGGNNEILTEVAVLADFAEHIAEITDDAIEKAKVRAEELRKKMENKEQVDFEHFEAELERSLTRVKIADKWRTRKYRK